MPRFHRRGLTVEQQHDLQQLENEVREATKFAAKIEAPMALAVWPIEIDWPWPTTPPSTGIFDWRFHA
jgi:hypothetical protein